jgi:hypothetical protein
MNDRNFSGYDGPCVCCPSPTPEKVTKAYTRGVSEENARIIALLKAEEKRLWEEDKNIQWSYAFSKAIDMIGEKK